MAIDGATEDDTGSTRQTGEDPDAALIRRVQRRDIDAFEQLFRRYQPRLRRFLSGFVRRSPLVDEALNDTMMVVWEKAATFSGNSRVSTWVFGIAYRQALKARRRDQDPIEDPETEKRPSSEPGPDIMLEQRRLSARLADAIAELGPAHRSVIELTYIQDMGYAEIATVLDCPVDTVKTRMFHARRKLRQLVTDAPAEWL